MALWSRVTSVILAQRGALMPWCPVFLGTGIGIYFAMPWEPPVAMLWVCLAGALALAALAVWLGPGNGPLVLAVALVLAGVALAGARAHRVAAPVLEFRYYGPIEGRVVGMDRSASGALRLTLDRVRLSDVRQVPERVRISLHGQGGVVPGPGMRVMTTGHLGPPQGPVEPGGFDFRRHAWFMGLGAVGYTRVPLLMAAPSERGPSVFATRMALSRAVQARLGGEVGGFAAAITTGDRAGMSLETVEELRRTNLAHLLAISGLHMGLLAGFVFAAVRLILNGVPWVGLRAPVRRIAAIAALITGAGYLALSGGNVATERAYVMVAVALVAVLFHRRAISLRAVGLAALILLSLRPEALLGPGFQMSFAATTALVAVFAALRHDRLPTLPRWARPVLAVVISSAVAGLATAPVAAVHFNRYAQFGLIANLLSVPLMGAVIMPAAVVAACLAPFGLEAPALWVMGQGLGWILGVAHEVSGWDGVVRGVPAPGPFVLPLLALGGLTLALWQGKARFIGGVPFVLGLLLWAGTERPAVLISESGGLVGVREAEGRALSRARGDGFVAQVWLENDGDLVAQDKAAARWNRRADRIAATDLPWGGTLWHVSGKRARDRFGGCRKGDIAVFNTEAPKGLDCNVFDPRLLRGTGALAFDAKGTLATVQTRTGNRLWSGAIAR
ncbi:ComEC/Rec2 family competence protein [Primorskyibacter aestuariivivens]|uniref:ComEC/Rec2 family competence protein n=1 Tax=Primorskyibacter aestuariivivens TaxID=1888912 RepID=UPI002301B59B|nr:ComEC/Rec2 family competence protein [Primorskyibacter aestuariivivens]MDA7429046.1 ComEC/Rec2 family competence protein [Primorskyibacter aestuariivivens]